MFPAKVSAHGLHPADPRPCPITEGHKYSTDYARSKGLAEAAVLEANYFKFGFGTLALRLPGIYGYGDPWVFGPLARGENNPSPADPAAKLEMVYVENAALAHVCAIETILGGGAAAEQSCGRCFHITNGEPEWTAGDFSKACQARFKAEQPHLSTHMPWVVAYVICCGVEFIWWFTQGNVPSPRHPVWDFTRVSLRYTRLDCTLSQEGNELIGYTPAYGVHESIEDIYARHKRGVTEESSKLDSDIKMRGKKHK